MTDAGEVVVSLSPVTLLTGVLGRLARTLAATAHFSLDRFSDVYLVTDTLAAHAAAAAAGSRIGARMAADERRLELTVGPFRSGTGAQLRSAARRPQPVAAGAAQRRGLGGARSTAASCCGWSSSTAGPQ